MIQLKAPPPGSRDAARESRRDGPEGTDRNNRRFSALLKPKPGFTFRILPLPEAGTRTHRGTELTAMTKTNDGRSGELTVVLAKSGALAIVLALSIAAMPWLMDHFRPRVGDIISFYPKEAVPPDTTVRFEVSVAGMPPNGQCLLDPRMMRVSGGSLIVEAAIVDSKFGYRVHWAGGPTSDARSNCGTSAELWLSQQEFGTLKMAASQ
jgi:hypothetical protein